MTRTPEGRLRVALGYYFENGGTIKRAMALIEEFADEMLGAGQSRGAEMAVYRVPAAQQQNSGAEAGNPNGQSYIAPETNRGTGQDSDAQKAEVKIPAREPSMAQIAAVKRGRKTSAAAVFGWLDGACIPGGPEYLDITWGSINGMIARMKAEGLDRWHAAYTLTRIRDEGAKMGVMPEYAKLRDTLPADTLKRISEETRPDRVAKEAREFIGRLNITAVSNALEARHD